jgi:hypothetical protein
MTKRGNHGVEPDGKKDLTTANSSFTINYNDNNSNPLAATPVGLDSADASPALFMLQRF